MILNGKLMNPGDLRTVVTFEQPVEQKTGGFVSKESYATIDTVKVKWTNAHGSEVWAAQSAQVLEPATILRRYNAAIHEGCTVLKGAKRYDVVSVDNIQERGEWMEIKVKRQVRR